MLNPDQLAQLEKIAGSNNLSITDADRNHHARDQSSHPASLPDAVVWAKSAEQLSRLLAWANNEGVPIVGWGAGSSLEGNPIPVHAGIVVNFQRMNHIVKLHAEDFQVTVQPGIFYKDMNRQLANSGLFFAPDPGANASVGGMIANNAAGARTVKYGATCDNVLGLELVLANGEIVRTGSRSVKQSAGYDLTRLIIGSEGTLGLVTEATLKLVPVPASSSAAIVAFETTAIAAQAVYEIMGSGIVPAALELLDSSTVAALNYETIPPLPVAPTLLMEFHGASPTALEIELNFAAEICQESGAQSIALGVGRQQRDKLWSGRHKLGETMNRLYPGHTFLITDVSVPISNYPTIAAFASQLMDKMGLPGALFGHAGDGNMHTVIFAPQGDPARIELLGQFNDQVVRRALELDGTCTGEHGVGIGKRKYMAQEHGESGLTMMRHIKAALDPNHILNPGKLL